MAAKKKHPIKAATKKVASKPTKKAASKQSVKSAPSILRNIFGQFIPKFLRGSGGKFAPRPVPILKKATRETKRDTKQVAKTYKAAKKLVKALSPKPPKKSAKKKQPKKSAPTVSRKQAPRSKPRPQSKQPQQPKTQQRVVSTSQKSSRTKGKLPSRDLSSYTLTELAQNGSSQLPLLFADVERNWEAIDRLKAPGQRWAFSIYDRHSLRVYRSMKSVAQFLSASNGLSDDDNPNLYQKIQFVKVGDLPEEYIARRIQEQKAAKKLNRKIDTAARKRVGGVTETGRRKTKTEIIGDLLSADEAKEKRIADLEAKLDAFIAKSSKPTKKKAAKKATKKKK